MCGISGAIGLSFDRQIAGTVLQTMKRRGPDGQGLYMDDRCMLLHTRLAIIDPTGGIQPMNAAYPDEEYIITYNGELYNTAEIRAALENRGHRFVTRSDTEVVLRAYVQWKEECLDRLNGIFAFAVWEKKRKRLFLARDRMGVKPLYYTLKQGGLIFGSELKNVLAYPQVDAELTAEGASEIILLGPGRTPGSGVFHNISELEPGWYGFFEGGKLTKKQYWKLYDAGHEDSLEQTIEKVRWLVTDSIKRQMVSDVPIGTFLSGGLDSSIISAVCAANQQEILMTFSVDYENQQQYFVPGKFQPTSDTYYINRMMSHLNSNHHWSVLNAEQLFEALEEATEARDLPGMADVDYSLLLFCGQMREHVKVALSGECADEIFGGYPWYRDPEIRDADGFPWAQNTAFRSKLLHPDRVFCNPEEFVMDRYRQTVLESDILNGTCAAERRMKEMVNLNQRWFMQTLLDRKDRMSMYHALEVRVPFCDHRIAEYLYTVPWEMKDLGGKEKGLLRAAMSDLLPDEILWRKKSPYPKTFDPRFGELVKGRLADLMNDHSAPLFQIVSIEAVRALMDGKQSWPWYGQLMREPQTMAYLLQIDFWLRKYKIRIL